MLETDLSSYSNTNFHHGRSVIIRLTWMLVSRLFFQTNLPYPSSLKKALLRLFGAKVGKGVVIKQNLNLKHPWRLEVGDYTWIGEHVWIDNLVLVKIGSNCCISQGAFLLTGNHNYKSVKFDLMTSEINIENGVWIGAKSIVGPGVTCSSHSILVVGSATFNNMNAYSIYQGNPAQFKRTRKIN
jgi:putative colanic acid biosynthesis acetyltransferase WcaF